MFPLKSRYFRIILSICLMVLLVLLSTGVKASDNLIESNRHFKVMQGNFCQEVKPLASSKSAGDFYNYSNFESHSGLERSNGSLMFLYEDMRTKVVSLFVIHDKSKDGSGGKAQFSFSWLPENTKIAVKDDVRDYFFPDNYSFHPPMATAEWQWKPDHTDGLVISGIKADGLDMKIKPRFIAGIDKWIMLSGKADDPVRIQLPSLTEPVFIGLNKPPQANFTYDPNRPEPGKPLTFDASSSFDSDGEVVKYEWDFGDGTHSFKKNPIHIYRKPGVHRVSLTITDNCGAKDEILKTIIPIEVSAHREIKAFPSVKNRNEPKDDPPQQILAGIPFEVRVKVKANLDVGTIGLWEKIPEGWKIKELPQEDKPPDPMKQKASEIQWFWTGLKRGAEREVVYQVTVPTETPPTEIPQKIRGDVEGFSPEFEIPVKGDSRIEVVEALPLKVVIASLDPHQDKKDPYCIKWTNDNENMDCYVISPELPHMIDDWEIKQAYKFWQNNEEVPLTGGKKIDFKTLLRLDTYHRTQRFVIEPLD